MPHFSTKTYGHEVGLSCAFRQPRAHHSHCSKIHGYALSFKFVFGCYYLDDNNWVVDFGGLKSLKAALVDSFDHKTVIDVNDPHLEWFEEGAQRGVLDLVLMQNGVGCEKFAEHAFKLAQLALQDMYPDSGRVWVESCECAEHGANSAVYVREHNQEVRSTNL